MSTGKVFLKTMQKQLSYFDRLHNRVMMKRNTTLGLCMKMDVELLKTWYVHIYGSVLLLFPET